jgi:hypothetical protein
MSPAPVVSTSLAIVKAGTSQVSSPSTTTLLFSDRVTAEHPLCGGYCR